MICVNCGKTLTIMNRKYCNNICQADYRYKTYIAEWKLNKVNGNRGVYAQNISAHLIRYLKSKYQACASCGWSMINPITKRTPLEVDHIDGNFENNSERNLRLLCPNCHSLTPTYRNLNKGMGRNWRRLKYIKQ